MFQKCVECGLLLTTDGQDPNVNLAGGGFTHLRCPSPRTAHGLLKDIQHAFDMCWLAENIDIGNRPSALKDAVIRTAKWTPDDDA